MQCWDNIIGIQDDCTSTVYKYLLDTYGFSLYNAAKIADERFKTGKAVVDSIINRGWQDTYDLITIDNFDINKILVDHEFGTPDCDESVTGGSQTIVFKTGKKGKLSEFYVPYVFLHVKTGGVTTITLTYETAAGTTTKTLYDAVTVANDTIYKIPIELWAGQQFSLTVDLTNITVCKMIKNYNCQCTCESFTATGDLGGLSVGMQIRCNKNIHLCKFNDVIAPVAIHRILALCWNEVLVTNRFSEFTQFKAEQALGQMVYHDSSFPIMENGEVKFSPVKGQFQMKLKNLKIPPPKCPCCLECKGGARVVTTFN